LGVGYHVESIAFSDPRDLFVHGVIDNRRGTCVSLAVLYMAIGHRLG
jgi:regulator of sirC expression with transglutaminase-like and TPR domain